MNLVRTRSTLLIFLILILMNLIVEPVADYEQQQQIKSTNSTNSAITASQNEKFLNSVNSQQFENSELTPINSTSRYSSVISLDNNLDHVIPSNSLTGSLEFNTVNSYKDLFEINSVLYPKLVNNGVGNLNKELIQPNVLNLNINDTIYSNSLSTILSQSLTGNEIIELQIEELSFQFNQEDFAYANIVFEFDNFNLIVVYRNTQSYIDFGFTTNSSDSIKILNPITDLLKIDIHQLTSIHNISSPNSIVALNWNVYSDKIYDFSASFNKISLVSEFDPSIRLNNEFLDISANFVFLLIPLEEYILTVVDEIDFLEIEYTVMYKESIQLDNHIYYSESLNINSTIAFNHFPEGSTIEIFLPTKFEVIFIDSIYTDLHYHNNRINFTLTEIGTLFMTATFTYDPAFEYTSNKLQQGTIFQISEGTNIAIDGMIISSKGSIIQFYQTNDSIQAVIPKDWEKGELTIILWFKDGAFYKFIKNLEYHPSKLISRKNYTIGIAERSTFRIMVQNVTSQSILEATTIYSYFQGKLRNIDTNHGLVINPGEFTTGTHNLIINATYSGLVPVVFELSLFVEPFDPHIHYEITRYGVNSILFIFEIPAVNNWSLNSYLRIQGENFNDTFEFWKDKFEIDIHNENWINTTLTFNIMVILGDNITNQAFDIMVPYYYENNTNKSNNPNNNSNGRDFDFVSNIGIITFTSSIGIIGYKSIKSKYGTEKISF